MFFLINNTLWCRAGLESPTIYNVIPMGRQWKYRHQRVIKGTLWTGNERLTSLHHLPASCHRRYSPSTIKPLTPVFPIGRTFYYWLVLSSTVRRQRVIKHLTTYHFDNLFNSITHSIHYYWLTYQVLSNPRPHICGEKLS